MNRDKYSMEIWVLCFLVVILRCIANRGADVSLLEKSINVGENPVFHLQSTVHGTCSQSRVPRNWSVKWVVNFI